uniref:Type IV secretion system protein virB10 n=1 Tax=Ochrobactrum sp. LM19 TaxID=1449781 RepID=A0A0D5A1D0_9HYPH|nr:type IV secretion system protein VirB10 [Ochrobactrum sp. LM19]AJW30008.1 type IV secretion protein VirB10 [Ochrobactrum sp. LM19]
MTISFEEEASGNDSVISRKRGDGGSGRASKLLLIASALLGTYVLYGYVNQSSTTARQVREEFRTPLEMPEFTFDAPVAAPSDNRLVMTPPDVPAKIEAPVIAPPVIQVPPPMVDDSAAREAAAEAERLRREAEARKLERLRSGMLIMSDQGAGVSGENLAGGGNQVAAIAPDDDPNRRFVAAAAAQDVEVVKASRNDRIDALIPQGTMIRGVLETAIQSDLPGMVRAIVSTDVWSFDGRRILIPRGTMLTGEYRSGLARGQTRVLIVWTRALRADGTSVALGSYGTDDLGRSGLTGKVDKHYLERFGSAAVLSIVGGAASFVAGLNKDGSSSDGGSDRDRGLSQAQTTVSQTMSDMANQALADSINIPPTIHVDQGAQIMVFVRRDLDFSNLYADPVKEALHELRRQKSVSAGRR